MAYLFTKTDALIVYRIQQRMRLRPSVDCMKTKKEKYGLLLHPVFIITNPVK